MAAQVTNALLGGSFGSRITRNIRENKGYTYSPGSSLSSRVGDAYWAESADVVTQHTGASLREIFLEIERLRSEPPSAEELRGIQNFLAGTFVLQNSTPGGIIGQLRFMDLHGLERSYLENYVRNVYAVTPADVQRVARPSSSLAANYNQGSTIIFQQVNQVLLGQVQPEQAVQAMSQQLERLAAR